MTSYPVRLFELRCRARRGTPYSVASRAVEFRSVSRRGGRAEPYSPARRALQRSSKSRRAQLGTLYGVARVAVGRSSTPFRSMFRKAIKQCGFDLKKNMQYAVCQRISLLS
ncbi:hypothetical protein [Porphyromonas gingivalis]|uniref:hypothetical protein n=1 Tax=Porphyromonas gingivalis TaxID=837 RepID=UPI001180B014|nr:hypothetical protein [Porphyromonas gingivalis]